FSSRRRHTRCYRDWSSDVCSSDLPIRLQFAVLAVAACLVPLISGAADASKSPLDTPPGVAISNTAATSLTLSWQVPAGAPTTVQIGRASCRERGESAERARTLKDK